MTEQYQEAWTEQTQIITRDDGTEYSITSYVKNTVPGVKIYAEYFELLRKRSRLTEGWGLDQMV